MKLLKVIVDFFRVKSIQAENALINPVDQSVLAIKDSEEQVSRFKGAIAKAMAQNKTLDTQNKAAKLDVEKFTRIAQLAVEAGNDEDAKEALLEKNKAQIRSNTLSTQIDTNNGLITQQRAQLERIEEKISNAKNNQTILTARLEGANARKELSKAGDEAGNGDGLAKLDNLQKAVDQAEGEAAAFEDLNGTYEIPLEEKYSNANFSVDNELAQLKAAKKKKN